MIEGRRVVAIIPARGGSKRLPRKNIVTVWGKPMLYWSIRACQRSKYIDEVFVSTEDKEVAELATKFGSNAISRPATLATDHVFKQDVIVHAAESLSEPKPELLISLQANSPEICAGDLDAALEKLVQFDRSEIFSVDKNLIQNAAFRVMRYEYAFQKSISTRSGVFVTSYVDVHTPEDLAFVEENRRPCGESEYAGE